MHAHSLHWTCDGLRGRLRFLVFLSPQTLEFLNQMQRGLAARPLSFIFGLILLLCPCISLLGRSPMVPFFSFFSLSRRGGARRADQIRQPRRRLGCPVMLCVDPSRNRNAATPTVQRRSWACPLRRSRHVGGRRLPLALQRHPFQPRREVIYLRTC